MTDAQLRTKLDGLLAARRQGRMDILSPAELLDLVGRFGAEPLVQTINAQVIGVTTSCGGAVRGPPRKVTTAAHMTLSQMVSVYISASSNTFAALTGACATFEELILQHLVSAGFGGKYGSLAVLRYGFLTVEVAV